MSLEDKVEELMNFFNDSSEYQNHPLDISKKKNVDLNKFKVKKYNLDTIFTSDISDATIYNVDEDISELVFRRKISGSNVEIRVNALLSDNAAYPTNVDLIMRAVLMELFGPYRDDIPIPMLTVDVDRDKLLSHINLDALPETSIYTIKVLLFPYSVVSLTTYLNKLKPGMSILNLIIYQVLGFLLSVTDRYPKFSIYFEPDKMRIRLSDIDGDTLPGIIFERFYKSSIQPDIKNNVYKPIQSRDTMIMFIKGLMAIQPSQSTELQEWINQLQNGVELTVIKERLAPMKVEKDDIMNTDEYEEIVTEDEMDTDDTEDIDDSTAVPPFQVVDNDDDIGLNQSTIDTLDKLQRLEDQKIEIDNQDEATMKQYYDAELTQNERDEIAGIPKIEIKYGGAIDKDKNKQMSSKKEKTSTNDNSKQKTSTIMDAIDEDEKVPIRVKTGGYSKSGPVEKKVVARGTRQMANSEPLEGGHIDYQNQSQNSIQSLFGVDNSQYQQPSIQPMMPQQQMMQPMMQQQQMMQPSMMQQQNLGMGNQEDLQRYINAMSGANQTAPINQMSNLFMTGGNPNPIFNNKKKR